MDFSFPPEHLELAQELRRWLTDHYDLVKRRQAINSGIDPVWAGLETLGVHALTVPESHGGLGGSAIDLLPVMQELGRALAITPLWSTAVTAKALEWGGAEALCARLLPAVAEGKVRFALALGESGSRHELDAIETKAVLKPDGSYTLHGEKVVVLFGSLVDHWLVSARCGDELALYLIPADASKVRITSYQTIDNIPAATLVFDGTAAAGGQRLDLDDGKKNNGLELLQRVADFGASLLCAESLGLMELAKETTVTHLQTRKQFGSLLGKFQVLQHRMVDVLMHLEQARSLTWLAAVQACSSDSAERIRSVSAAKALVGEAGHFVGQQCVQLHGAIGLTDEMVVAHTLKRLTMINQTLGDSDHHLARFAAVQVH